MNFRILGFLKTNLIVPFQQLLIEKRKLTFSNNRESRLDLVQRS